VEYLRAGDIVWRIGTVGVQKEPVKIPVMILAAHRDEGIHNRPIYTCAPICDKPFKLPGDCPVKMPSGKSSTVRLGKFLIAGEESLIKRDGVVKPFHRASSDELSSVRMKMEALLTPQQPVLGTVVHSATPSHEGGRGKVNRPYVLVCEIGKGSGNYWAVPVSSRESKIGLGAKIGNLEACGLRRSEGYQSYTRLSWSASVAGRTSDLDAKSPKLSQGDMIKFVSQVKNFAKMMVMGEVRAFPPSTQNLENLIESSRGLTPHCESKREPCLSIAARSSCLSSSSQDPRITRESR
jgi:hypothetical protein